MTTLHSPLPDLHAAARRLLNLIDGPLANSPDLEDRPEIDALRRAVAQADEFEAPRSEAAGHPSSQASHFAIEEKLALSVAEAAVLLGVAPLTLYRAIDRGELTALKVGRRVLIPRRALDELLAGKASS